MDPIAVEPDSPSKPRPASSRDMGTHLMLALPVFLLYQLGLLISPEAANGVDVFTRSLGYLAGLSWTVYLVVVLVLAAVYGLALRSMLRKQRLVARRFPIILLEGAVYAVLMGPVAGLLLSKLHVLGAWLEQMGILDRIVASAGAGFYEELVFRLGLLAGSLWLLEKKGLNRWLAILLAVLVTSVVFSAVHYVGAGSDPFDLASFAYRSVLGGFLAAIFLLRGFATAVYAHFFYDVYVLVILMGA